MEPAKKETATGTTTASHPGVVVAAGGAAAGAQTNDADVATLATGPPRYGKVLLPPYPLFCLYRQIERVIITGV